MSRALHSDGVGEGLDIGLDVGDRIAFTIWNAKPSARTQLAGIPAELGSTIGREGHQPLYPERQRRILVDLGAEMCVQSHQLETR